MNTTVSCELHLRLVVSSESSLPVPAGLRYDTADTYAVHATFH
ncbi:SsgA family sporulation/cell division regulator, partial [Streptomyces sp. SID1034]|nr:SsgA family sporulation/cell division regulator [Streptomyces sp. SID1034]